MKAPYRVLLSEQTTANLRSLTQKTGLSANILSRFAMLISFEDSTAPAADAGKGLLTINRTTLFGELEPFLMAAYSLVARKQRRKCRQGYWRPHRARCRLFERQGGLHSGISRGCQ